MIEIDDRLSSIAGIDKTRAALVSSTSLMTIARVLEDNQIPDERLEKLLLDPYGMVLANIIQTLVVHETVYADSILFDRNNDLNWAETKFPGVIRRLFVPPDMRADIAETMNSIRQTAPDSYETDMSGDDRLMKILLDRQTAAEKPLLDALHDEKHSSLRVPPGTVINDELRHQAILWTKIGLRLPRDVLVSMNTGARAFYYLELAQRTGLPLAVDPPRSKYLTGLLGNVVAALDTPGMLLDMFDETVVPQERLDSWRKEGLRSTEVRIPPVAEYAIRTARQRHQGLYDALVDIRMSKPARDFRDMCAQVRALRDDGSTAALLARDKMIAELKQLGQKWAENCGPITDYRVREINIAELIAGIFEAIPLLGAVGKGIKAALTSTHFDKVKLTPKFFWKRPALKCELFLSDLYAAPSKL